MHGHSQSMSYSTAEADELAAGLDGEHRTPSRRGTYSRLEIEGLSTGIPVPSSIPMPSSTRRQSGGGAVGRRTSSGAGLALPGTTNVRTLEDVGETY